MEGWEGVRTDGVTPFQAVCRHRQKAADSVEKLPETDFQGVSGRGIEQSRYSKSLFIQRFMRGRLSPFGLAERGSRVFQKNWPEADTHSRHISAAEELASGKRKYSPAPCNSGTHTDLTSIFMKVTTKMQYRHIKLYAFQATCLFFLH